ncbi:hypothetical protein C1645_809289 [Glomus cerebriforme]|uniref:Protein kinase domain-containing protein n=1 Tax=Glomus cerebriforme TaxID=658196 RepID=A0A397SKF0_9GLOM|nr:hypothetical protein C1645_809289 [Glomus cerebriforme]
MPFMAPEILRGKEYTKKSDIYSLGIIMNEIFSIIPPFNDEPHDHYLALDICRENRPSSEEVYKEIGKIGNQIRKVKKLPELTYNFTPITKSTTKTQFYETHTQAIYKSRLLNLSNLPEPENCSNQEGFISSRNTAEIKEVNTECLDCIVTDLSKLDVSCKK